MKYMGCIIFFKNRKNFPDKGYRPHLAVQNSNVLIGVEFVWFEQVNIWNVPIRCEFKSIYDSNNYNLLIPNNTYDIKEGSQIVGQVTILSSEL